MVDREDLEDSPPPAEEQEVEEVGEIEEIKDEEIKQAEAPAAAELSIAEAPAPTEAPVSEEAPTPVEAAAQAEVAAPGVPAPADISAEASPAPVAAPADDDDPPMEVGGLGIRGRELDTQGGVVIPDLPQVLSAPQPSPPVVEPSQPTPAQPQVQSREDMVQSYLDVARPLLPHPSQCPSLSGLQSPRPGLLLLWRRRWEDWGSSMSPPFPG